MRESSVGTYIMRLENLECLGANIHNWVGLMKVHEFYSYFLDDHQQTVK